MELKKSDITLAIALAVIIAAGLVAGGFFIGDGFYMSRMGDRYVTVKGLAEKDVSADLAVWNLKIAATGDDLGAVQDRIEQDKAKLLTFLKDNGITEEETSAGRISVTDLMAQEYRQERAENSRFIINFSVSVRSTDIDKINKASGGIGNLVRKGLVLDDGQGPNYIFTKLNEIKPSLIAEATKNARQAAEQFAADSGSRVGSIRRATQGIISIEARDGAPRAADEGMYDDTQMKRIDKKVRVVTTIDYALER